MLNALTGILASQEGMYVQDTHDLLLVEVSTAVGCSKCRRAGLAVPGHVSVLSGAANGQSVNAVGVSITVTAVLLPASITRRPHKD